MKVRKQIFRRLQCTIEEKKKNMYLNRNREKKIKIISIHNRFRCMMISISIMQNNNNENKWRKKHEEKRSQNIQTFLLEFFILYYCIYMLFKLKKNIFHSKRYLTNSIDFMYERIVIKLQGKKVKEKIEFHRKIHLFKESCHRNKSFVSRKLTNTRKKSDFLSITRSYVNRYM